MATFLAVVGMFVSVVLIIVILLQRGRGGGLVGALSGLGGQSAFGTKAGDTFTRITIIIAAVWIGLAGIEGKLLRASKSKFKGNDEKQIDVRKDNETEKKSDGAKVDNSDLFSGDALKTDEPAKTDGSKADPEKDDPAKKPAETPDGEAKKSDNKTDKPSEPKADAKDEAKPSDLPKKDDGDSGEKKSSESE